MKYVPWLSRFCWNTVMVLEKEKQMPKLVEQWMENVGSASANTNNQEETVLQNA